MTSFLLSAYFITQLLLVFGLYKVWYKTKLDKKSGVTVINGWHHLNWEDYKNDTNLSSIEQLLIKIKSESDWEKAFTEQWLHKIYFMDAYSLLKLSIDLYKSKRSAKEIENLKRIVTISSVLFNFSVPAKLWLADEATLLAIIKYCIITDTVDFDINNYNIKDFKVSSLKEIKDFESNLECILYGMTLITKMGKYRAPNSIVLCTNVIKDNPKMWNILGRDIDNLKRVMTICFSVSGISIPKDYILVDENVYHYLTEPGYFNKQSKTHLSIVGKNKNVY